MIKQQIKDHVGKALEDLGISYVDPIIDYPADPKHGDYTTNAALVASKKVGKNPRDLASELQKKLQSSEIFEKVEVAGPGFINFWVKDEVLVENALIQTHPNPPLSGREQADSSPDKGRLGGVFSGKKIMVEYTDPNPFKELHIGHLYSNIIGESLSRLFEASGAEVCRVDYYGDVGMHVAKSIWGLRQNLKEHNTSMEDLAKKPLHDRVKFLGEAYAFGSNAYADDPNVAEEVKDINYLVYMSGQDYQEKKLQRKPQVNYKKYLRPENEGLFEAVKHLYEIGKDWSLEYFETLYKRLGTKFDRYYPESIAGEWGYQVVNEHIDDGVFVRSEGAIIFPGEKYGLHNRVFINKLGLPTYEAKELGLMPWKYSEFPYDYSFIVTATEIAGYFGVLRKAMTQVNPELGDKTTPLLHGMVKLPEGKMSSRSGNVITVNSLLDEAKERVLPRVSEEIENRDDVGEIVGVGAVKYAFLKSSIGKDMVFDFDESVSFDGNSGPYLQYTFARTQSVLRKAEENHRPHPDPLPKGEGKLAPEERELLRLLVQFDEVVEEAAIRYSPNVICTYLFELAQAFNLFYQKHQIINPSTSFRDDVSDIRGFRLALTKASGETLKQGLYLLGIKAPERM